MLCSAMLAVAQSQQGNHLLMGERWPTYYYGDGWVDMYLAGTHEGDVGAMSYNDDWCKPEYARCIYADSLRVIGIAAGLNFWVKRDEFVIWDEYGGECDPYANFQTEYFSLYEIDTATGDMVLVVKKPLTDLSVACYLPRSTDGPMFGVYPAGIPMREVYFDSAITVYDSFYLSVTSNNNWRRHPSDTEYYCHVETMLMGNMIFRDNKPLAYPTPRRFKRKLHLVNGWDNDNRFCVTDTNWHTFHTDFAENYIEGMNPGEYFVPNDWFYFMTIFPIIDTSTDHTWMPECIRPYNLGTIHVGKEVVVMGWDSYGAGEWELKVAKEDEGLESATPMSCTSDVVPVYGLDTATWYVATVRSVCRENHFSDWSDTIRFFVPGDTTATDPLEGVETLAERYTYMMPNPATEQVTVMSSFRIESVEVYSLTGQRLMQEKVGGLSAQIGISRLPKGTYLVRIHTNHGTSSKRLVVK